MKIKTQTSAMRKASVGFVLAFTVLLCACSPLALNHIIVNESDAVLEIEYEYVLPMTKYDKAQITTPAKMTFGQYNEEDSEKYWRGLTATQDYEFEARQEERIIKINGKDEHYKQPHEICTVRLKILPGEVLRVFTSARINSDIKNLKRISLTGEKGKLEIKGDGFEQFTEVRTGGFFSGRTDYRIVYK